MRTCQVNFKNSTLRQIKIQVTTNIDTVVIKNTLEHIFKFSGVFKNDLHGGLNTFVVYGDTEEIKDRKGAVYLYNYDIKVVYPVKRDSFPLSNNDLPKDRILRYELW